VNSSAESETMNPSSTVSSRELSDSKSECIVAPDIITATVTTQRVTQSQLSIAPNNWWNYAGLQLGRIKASLLRGSSIPFSSLPHQKIAEFLDMKDLITLSHCSKELLKKRQSCMPHVKLNLALMLKHFKTYEKFEKFLPVACFDSVISLHLTGTLLTVRNFENLKALTIQLGSEKVQLQEDSFGKIERALPKEDHLHHSPSNDIKLDALLDHLTLENFEHLSLDSLSFVPDLSKAVNLKTLSLVISLCDKCTKLRFKCGSKKLECVELCGWRELGSGTTGDFDSETTELNDRADAGTKDMQVISKPDETCYVQSNHTCYEKSNCGKSHKKSSLEELEQYPSLPVSDILSVLENLDDKNSIQWLRFVGIQLIDGDEQDSKRNTDDKSSVDTDSKKNSMTNKNTLLGLSQFIGTNCLSLRFFQCGFPQTTLMNFETLLEVRLSLGLAFFNVPNTTGIHLSDGLNRFEEPNSNTSIHFSDGRHLIAADRWPLGLSWVRAMLAQWYGTYHILHSSNSDSGLIMWDHPDLTEEMSIVTFTMEYPFTWPLAYPNPFPLSERDEAWEKLTPNQEAMYELIATELRLSLEDHPVWCCRKQKDVERAITYRKEMGELMEKHLEEKELRKEEVTDKKISNSCAKDGGSKGGGSEEEEKRSTDRLSKKPAGCGYVPPVAKTANVTSESVSGNAKSSKSVSGNGDMAQSSSTRFGMFSCIPVVRNRSRKRNMAPIGYESLQNESGKENYHGEV